jgi:hypothetical protein
MRTWLSRTIRISARRVDLEEAQPFWKEERTDGKTG